MFLRNDRVHHLEYRLHVRFIPGRVRLQTMTDEMAEVGERIRLAVGQRRAEWTPGQVAKLEWWVQDKVGKLKKDKVS